MNKRVDKALLTGKRPRSSLKGVRGGVRVFDVGWENGTPAVCTELSEMYDEFCDIILRGLGVPAHLLRNT